MALFKCKMCGGALDVTEAMRICECKYCGTIQTLPELDSDKKINLYDRANHFRRNNDFDKAMSIYETILNDNPEDAESYWSIVLCRYGIEYVEDPSSHKRIPTINRSQYTSIFADEDYRSALRYADASQKEVYQAEAQAIDNIQKGILDISEREEPFDVFICYKETDANGRRTPDSVLATDLYHQLKNEGYKVFFSRITLEDKLGQEYEPYIFAALNSAKVMVVLGTKPEYFNAVWVRNEWSRFLSMIKNGKKKILIPAYKDMDPYDLPEEFSHLQAQDMSRLGFMQDLIRGIKKITAKDEPPFINNTVVVNSGNANINSLLERVFIFLEDGDWESADEYCEKALDIEPKNSIAYLGKLMAELKVRNREGLRKKAHPFDKSGNYQKAVRYGDDALKKELEDCTNYIIGRNNKAYQESVYQDALKLFNDRRSTKKEIAEAKKYFESIAGYKDADKYVSGYNDRINEIDYREAVIIFRCGGEKIDEVKRAEKIFEKISGYKDADEYIQKCSERIDYLKKLGVYNTANAELSDAKTIYADADSSEQFDKAINCLDFAEKGFREVGDFQDSAERIQECEDLRTEYEARKNELEQLKLAAARKKKIIAAVVSAAALIAVAAVCIVIFVIPEIR